MSPAKGSGIGYSSRLKRGMLTTYNDEASATLLFLSASTLAEPVESGRHRDGHMVVLRLVLMYESWWISLIKCAGQGGARRFSEVGERSK